MSDTPPEGKHERVDFSEQAERAAKLRLAGDLAGAEAIYQAIIDLGNARAEGYGNQHLGLCTRSRAEAAREAGDTELADTLFAKAGAEFARGIRRYGSVGDFVRTSAVRLDLGVLYLRQGVPELAITAILDSIKYLREHADEESNQGLVDEHLGIKYARLAETSLAMGDVAGARKAIETALVIPQRNSYFVMVTTEINGYVYRAEGDVGAARAELTTAAWQADAQGDSSSQRRILNALDELRA